MDQIVANRYTSRYNVLQDRLFCFGRCLGLCGAPFLIKKAVVLKNLKPDETPNEAGPSTLQVGRLLHGQ